MCETLIHWEECLLTMPKWGSDSTMPMLGITLSTSNTTTILCKRIWIFPLSWLKHSVKDATVLWEWNVSNLTVDSVSSYFLWYAILNVWIGHQCPQWLPLRSSHCDVVIIWQNPWVSSCLRGLVGNLMKDSPLSLQGFNPQTIMLNHDGDIHEQSLAEGVLLPWGHQSMDCPQTTCLFAPTLLNGFCCFHSSYKE